MIRRKRINESDQDLFDMKNDLDKLLDLNKALNPVKFKDYKIRDIVSEVQAIIALLL